MAHAKPFLAVIPGDQVSPGPSSEHCTRVQPEYVTVVNARRKFVEVSPSFCKLLGYVEEELLGRTFDDFTAPRTINIPIIWRLFLCTESMVGIWVFLHRSGTKLFVRYEAFTRADGMYEAHMELLGAGA
jgi:PAS domain S-box-containing protein